jgi:hypothetical protein
MASMAIESVEHTVDAVAASPEAFTRQDNTPKEATHKRTSVDIV